METQLPPGELPGVLGALARCYPVAVPRDWGLAQLHSIPGKQGAQGWHTGTPPAGITAMAPWEEAGTGSRAWQGWGSVPTHLMWVMRVVLGLGWESQGCHGARVSTVNIRPNSGSQEW